MPTPQSFALMTQEAIQGADLFPHDTRCHSAVLYWMFRALGDLRPAAIAKLKAISERTCPNHAHGQHVSIPAQWFGRQLYVIYSQVLGRAQLRNAVDVGDVLVTNNPALPNHSMVVVIHRYTTLRSNTNIRGFNNAGTFGGSAPLNSYDHTERHCDVGNLWHGNNFGFAAPGHALYCVKFDDYLQCASALRGMIIPAAAAGTFTYTGPA